ncbi:tetraspanin-1-like [Leguminivora glycinivorella]|uniref:tetraspanin-1-like n=1 Tax=Leguminivora glycinivorella TaxID=1035111 RepID=UPI00200D8D7E|nr:tetraspanin-1-like [Leguminivora glycinivorella]
MHSVMCPRTCLGFTNFLFFFMGLIGFGICLWCAINTELFRDLNYTVTRSELVGTIADFVNLKLWLTPLTTVISAAAIVAMLTTCCGILGAGCKTKCAIKSYIFLVSVICSVAFWFIYISCIYNIYSDNEKTRKFLQSTLRTQYGKENDLFTSLWNYIMVNYECCGVVSFADFKDSYWVRMNPDKLFPVQCCNLQNRTHLIPSSKDCQVTLEFGTFNSMGCFQALRQSLVDSKVLIILSCIMCFCAYASLMSFAYCVLRGEPLITDTDGYMYGARRRLRFAEPEQSESSLQNMMFVNDVSEPTTKVVRVVSAGNPYQKYKYYPEPV